MSIEELVIILIVMVLIFIAISWTQKDQKPKPRWVNDTHDKNKQISDLNLLFDRATKEFLNLNVRKHVDRIIISENVGIRRESRELVFISLKPNRKKYISKQGDFLVARYPYVPTGKEMRKDFARITNKY